MSIAWEQVGVSTVFLTSDIDAANDTENEAGKVDNAADLDVNVDEQDSTEGKDAEVDGTDVKDAEAQGTDEKDLQVDDVDEKEAETSDIGGADGMEDMVGEGDMQDTMMGETQAPKDPLLSNGLFFGGISILVFVVGGAIGALLARKKIKKGIELYEDD